MPEEKITDEELIFLRHLGFNQAEIARLKSVTQHAISQRMKPLVEHGYAFNSRCSNTAIVNYRKRKSLEAFEETLLSLRKSGGAVERKLLKRYGVVTSMVNQNLVYEVRFWVKYGTGSGKRFVSNKLFKKRYVGKCFVCLGRTGVIRLLQKACKKPTTPGHQHQLTFFLNKYLSGAEKIAVLWKLGVRKFAPSQLKSSIEVDGVYAARAKIEV